MPIYTNRFDFFFYISAAEKKMRAFKKIIVGKTFFRSAVKAETLGRKDGTIASQLFFFFSTARERGYSVWQSPKGTAVQATKSHYSRALRSRRASLSQK